MTPAVTEQVAPQDETGKAVHEEQQIAEPQTSQLPATPYTEPSSPTDEAENNNYRALSDRISSVRRARVESLQLNPPILISIAETELAAAAESIVLETHPTVQVSIIIPVFNNLKFTLECLTSLVRYSGTIAYEVIVVEDGSTDRTQELLRVSRM